MPKKMPLFTKIGFDMAESRPRQVCDASWARVLTLQTPSRSFRPFAPASELSLRGPAARRPAAQREDERLYGTLSLAAGLQRRSLRSAAHRRRAHYSNRHIVPRMRSELVRVGGVDDRHEHRARRGLALLRRGGLVERDHVVRARCTGVRPEEHDRGPWAELRGDRAENREVEQREGDVPEDGLEPDLQEQEDGLPGRVDGDDPAEDREHAALENQRLLERQYPIRSDVLKLIF